MKIICVGGLPGSGKTYLGKSIAEKYGYILFDDINNKTITTLKEALKDNKSVIITDTYFCLLEDRINAEKLFKLICPACEIEWILFENDPETCRKNVEFRNDGRKVDMHINNLTKDYCSNGVAQIMPVWKN